MICSANSIFYTSSYILSLQVAFNLKAFLSSHTENSQNLFLTAHWLMKKSQYVHNPFCLAYRVIALYSVIDIPFLQFIKKFVAVPALSCSNVLITLHYHFPYLFLVFFYFPSIIQNLLWAHTTHLLLSNVSLVYSKIIPNTRN